VVWKPSTRPAKSYRSLAARNKYGDRPAKAYLTLQGITFKKGSDAVIIDAAIRFSVSHPVPQPGG